MSVILRALQHKRQLENTPVPYDRYTAARATELGIALWIGAWPMFMAPLAVFATVNWVHIPFEEAKMRRQFGADYDAYVARARRWL